MAELDMKEEVKEETEETAAAPEKQKRSKDDILEIIIAILRD